MTVTVKGFQGTLSDSDLATQFPHHAPVVFGTADCAVTAVSGARTVSVAAGSSLGGFIKRTSDAAEQVVLAPPGSGGKWYAISVNRQWSPTSTAVLQADDLAVTDGGTTQGLPAPAAVAAAAALPNQPGTAGSTAGQRQVLALVYVVAANTTLTIFDMRLIRTGAGPMRVQHLGALSLGAAAGHLLEGAVVAVGKHVLPSGGNHIRSQWTRRAEGGWEPTGRIIVNDSTATNASSASNPQIYNFGGGVYVTTGTSRADLLAIATTAYASACGLPYRTELVDEVSNVLHQFRGTGPSWQAWDSGWFDVTSTTGWVLPGATQYNRVSRYRMRGGVVRWEGAVTLQAGPLTQGNVYVSNPLPIENPALMSQGTQKIRVIMFNSSTGVQHEASAEIDPGSQCMYFKVPAGVDASPGYHLQPGGNVPFNEAWAQSDAIWWTAEYDPAAPAT